MRFTRRRLVSTMEIDQFSVTVAAICAGDAAFEPDAYLFVRDALKFTVRNQSRKLAGGSAAIENHVSGQQLLDGVRRYALDQYGPMVPTVFSHWRIESCEDIGRIVFKLIDAGEFGKTEQDTLADFQGGFDFEEAFVEPFRPAKPPLPGAPGSARNPRRPRAAKV